MKNSDKFWIGVFTILCVLIAIGCIILLWEILFVGGIFMYFMIPIVYFFLGDLELKNIKKDWWMWFNPIYWGIIAILLFNRWLDGLKF